MGEVDEDGERSNGMGMTGAGYIKSLSRNVKGVKKDYYTLAGEKGALICGLK